jgi:hypothetical protein
MENLRPDAVIVQCGIRIYPSTPLVRIAESEGRVLSDLLQPKFYVSPAVKDRLLQMTHDRRSRLPNLIFEGEGEGLSPEVVRRLRRAGLCGPLWLAKERLESEKRCPRGMK